MRRISSTEVAEISVKQVNCSCLESIQQLRLDGTRAETRFRLSAKRASPYDSAGAPVESTAGSRGVRVSW
jgi:hypothetical protein